MNQSQLLLEVFKLVAKSPLFPEDSMRNWVKKILFIHKKGYLYIAFENEKLAVATCAYRVKEAPKEYPERFPEKEEGDVFYVNFMISGAKDKMLPRRLLSRYLKRHPDIKEIAFHDLANDAKLKSYKKKPKNKEEKENGKGKEKL